MLDKLELRLGRLHARQRLGIERDHEAQIFGQGLNFFHIENWYSVHADNTRRSQDSRTVSAGIAERVAHPDLTTSIHQNCRFSTATRFWHHSDLHIDMNDRAMRNLEELLPNLEYDLCVMTGDYRGPTFGPFDAALEGMRRLRSRLRTPLYAVLGNHDTICMVPDFEDIGVRMLLNECEAISRGKHRIFLAGINDAHYFRVDNIEKAAASIPHESFSILLSHTPEIYRQAAHAGFDLLLSGHTHGGQSACPAAFQ